MKKLMTVLFALVATFVFGHSNTYAATAHHATKHTTHHTTTTKKVAKKTVKQTTKKTITMKPVKHDNPALVHTDKSHETVTHPKNTSNGYFWINSEMDFDTRHMSLTEIARN